MAVVIVGWRNHGYSCFTSQITWRKNLPVIRPAGFSQALIQHAATNGRLGNITPSLRPYLAVADHANVGADWHEYPDADHWR